MKLAVIGGRDFNDYTLLQKSILSHYRGKGVKMIISGGAKGADTLGERFAKDYKLDTVIFTPNWETYGKSAGFIRNQDIIRNSDHVIAFWDGKSKGTKNSIDIARKLGKELVIIMYTNSIEKSRI